MEKIEYQEFEFKGKINYFGTKDEIQISKCTKKLLKWVSHQDKKIPISLKIKFNSPKKGEKIKISLIQMCLNTEICYLFNVVGKNKLPESLIQLLGHKNVILHSNDITRQIKQIKNQFGLQTTAKTVNLGKFCNQVCGTTGTWKLEYLANYRCQKTIHKPCDNYCESDWEKDNLTDAQKLYAAKDVVIGQVIYKNLQLRSLDNEHGIVPEHDAYKEERERYQKLTPKQKEEEFFENFYKNNSLFGDCDTE